ncbi:hypothetical protein TRFO_09472 [Tritrichomonas foetus]|uniref:Uncharacterized protein n=1 Tax=Tritrichomonas foetus TaxID=1144522 RepID=A0A1J4JE77_9EUKA|nr:hypothetical protein TRFO_09472 [Tritrichomonas foetus]|eukprot:OHS97458.1 hypothetical protein TRFO_09472 [Tritrichomonas foetus]
MSVNTGGDTCNVFITNSKFTGCSSYEHPIPLTEETGSTYQLTPDKISGTVCNPPEYTITVQKNSDLSAYTIYYRIGESTKYQSLGSDSSVTNRGTFSIQFFVSNAELANCDKVAVTDKISVTEASGTSVELSASKIPSGSCTEKSKYTATITKDASLSGYDITYQIGSGSKLPFKETITEENAFEVSFYATNSDLVDCTDVLIGSSHSINNAAEPTLITLRKDDIPSDKCTEKQYTVKINVDYSLNPPYTIKYKIGEEDAHELTEKTISRKDPFSISFYATNPERNDCTDILIGNAFEVSNFETPTNAFLTQDNIPAGKCTEKLYTVIIEPNTADFDERFIFHYNINDGPIQLLEKLTISQSEAFNISIYLTGKGLLNCPERGTLLASPFEIKDNTKATTIKLSKKDIPEGYCVPFEPNEETQSFMKKLNDLTNKNVSEYVVEDGQSVKISNENAEITSKGSVTVKSESLSVGAISVNEGTVTIQGPLLTNVYMVKGKVVLHCDASTKTMPAGSIEQASSKLLDKEIKIDTLDIEIKMDGEPKEDFLLAIGTVSGFQPNLITSYQYRQAKAGDIVYVAGLGQIQYDSFASQYPDMYVLEVTKSDGANVGLIVGVVVAVVVVIVVVVVVVIIVLKKKKKDTSSH